PIPGPTTFTPRQVNPLTLEGAEATEVLPFERSENSLAIFERSSRRTAVRFDSSEQEAAVPSESTVKKIAVERMIGKRRMSSHYSERARIAQARIARRNPVFYFDHSSMRSRGSSAFSRSSSGMSSSGVSSRRQR